LEQLLNSKIDEHLITIADVSSKAIELSRKRYSKKNNIYFFNGLFTDCLSINKTYDLIISLRTIQSTGFNFELIGSMSDLLNTDGLLILSVANGYVGKNNSVVRGMYNHKTNSVDLKKPYFIVLETIEKLIKKNCSSFEVKNGIAEIFMIFKKHEK
jgi:2-polyprenyl-3-methyl-5-hydroxy-6-metoxy-1,4-benzoquinol methylase